MFDPIAYINEPRWQESRLGLDRIRDLLDRMGRPQDRLRFVHVAGTNGKGSTCAYLASILQQAGYRTGLFTSPYIMCFEERIRVDGRNIAMDDLRRATLFVKEFADSMACETGDHPTEFELMTAVAFEHFARSGCDIAVVEVGLGGRLDSTNVIESPEAAVLARIGLDHTGILGTDVAAVAAEKAGILKQGCRVVCYPQQPEAEAVVRSVASRLGCTLSEPDFSRLKVSGLKTGPAERSEGALLREFSYGSFDGLTTKLLGTYQPCNAALAIETALTLRAQGWSVSDDAIKRGIAATEWPGRFQVLPTPAGQPVVVADGGHNPQGARVLADSLRDVFPGSRIVFSMSVLADKDYRAMIDETAPLAVAYVTGFPDNPRALSAADLAAEIAERVSVPVQVGGSVADAVRAAMRLAGPDGVVCAFGSLYALSAVSEGVRAEAGE